MSAPQSSMPTAAIAAFRRRVDAFFADPRVPDRATAAEQDVPASPLGDVLARLGGTAATGEFSLRKSFTLHDGRVVSMTGDDTPLGADENVRIVTTTTSVLDAEGLRVETNVLVFEKGGRR